MSKPGACLFFLIKFDILVPNYSEGGYFSKMQQI